MGYRSTGRWVIKGPVEQVAAALAMAKLELPSPNDVDCSWDDFKSFRNDEAGYIRFQYDDWKWYTSYPSVGWYESVWNWFSSKAEEDDRFDGLCGKRIRLGEKAEDIETDTFGNDCYDIELYVRIGFNDGEPSASESLPLIN